MKVLFLTIGRMESINAHSIYADLLRHFYKNGHDVYTVSAYERSTGLSTRLINENENVHLLKVRVGNITKCGLIEKGISTLTIEKLYEKAINKYFKGISFDLILYSTPPITLAGLVKKIKKRDNAKSYLLLKDIFPQNAVDLGVLKKTGITSILYKIYRKKEIDLYEVSDYIGCMSQANVDFIKKNNPQIGNKVVEECPNSIEIVNFDVSSESRNLIRQKYGLPTDKVVFVYGGNLGKPQGIDFLIDCLQTQKDNRSAYFLIIGGGTEYGRLEDYFKRENPTNMKLIPSLPKEEYDSMLSACDVGMIFLNHNFTIPNFPSRLLTYMQAGLPVLACTDTNTDIGSVITHGNFGWWCESDNEQNFSKLVSEIINKENLSEYGENAIKYLKEHYTVERAYNIILKSIEG